MVKVWTAVVLLMACRNSERHELEIDRPDPAGDHALGLTPLDSSAKAQPGEQPLRAFSCTKPITGKRENGELDITFVPTTPADVAFRIQFRAARPACNYSTEIRLAAGRLNDGVLGLATIYRCRRSPLSAFAVSCGPYLGSDLAMLVRGNGWGRTVAFRMPWSFHSGTPDADVCTLPFVSDDGAIVNSELVFDLADCHWES